MVKVASIENKYLKVSINLNGGSLTSIIDKSNDRELFYQVDSRSWTSQDVVIFPLIARIKNGKYTVNDKEFSLKSHGIARYSTFEIKEQTKESITIKLLYNEETLKVYPFKFELDVIYTLKDHVLEITKEVNNLDDKDIYFYLGSHPALKVSGYETEKSFNFKDVYIDFGKPIKTYRYILNDDGSLLTGKKKEITLTRLAITKEFINEFKTIILDAKNIFEVNLYTKDYHYKFSIGNNPILAIWSKPGFGDFLCIEPW
ncbi:MAG: hypothetical protein WC174_04760, partial [Bacilli bacterium]